MLAFDLLFPIVLVVLLFGHRPLGWKMAVFNSGLVIMITVCFSVMGFRHLNSDLFYSLFTIALHAGLLRMFNKSDVQNFFGVNKKDFKKALVYSGIFGFVIVIAAIYTK